MMKKVFQVIYHLSGKIYVPHYLKNSSIKILHISDTPSYIYSDILSAINKIKPHYIIHTGDIADEIKLELFPFKTEQYSRLTNKFIQELSHLAQNQLIIVPGNHDNINLLNITSKIKVVNSGEILNIHGKSFGLAHKLQDLPNKGCDFYLYGHDNKTLGENYLNGIMNINILDLSQDNVFHLQYPIFTDNYRMLKRKIGI
ncbi:MAG: metallophosphoesterase [Clostridiales bacterium]|nr:metallophosphoesterase [Clostridiales bacterium]